jgi:hypothetical protein
MPNFVWAPQLHITIIKYKINRYYVFKKNKTTNNFFSDIPDELSYIVLLEDWEIASDNLELLDKKLGGGQFGIVMQGLLTTAKGDSEVVAVKMLKGIHVY